MMIDYYDAQFRREFKWPYERLPELNTEVQMMQWEVV